MTINFKKTPARVDTKTVPVFDYTDELVCNCTIRFQNTNSPEWLKQIRDARKTLKPDDLKRIDNPKTVEDIEFGRDWLLKFFVNHYLVGWDLQDADNKPVPFNKENAIAFFTQDDDHYSYVDRLDTSSKTALNFRKEEVAKTKNA